MIVHSGHTFALPDYDAAHEALLAPQDLNGRPGVSRLS